MNTVSEHMKAHLKDFQRGDVWQYLLSYLHSLIEEDMKILENAETTREQDLFTKGLIFRTRELIQLPETLIRDLEANEASDNAVEEGADE